MLIEYYRYYASSYFCPGDGLHERSDSGADVDSDFVEKDFLVRCVRLFHLFNAMFCFCLRPPDYFYPLLQ